MPKTLVAELSAEVQTLRDTIEDTESVLFDSVIETALRHLALKQGVHIDQAGYPYQFACKNAIQNIGTLKKMRGKRMARFKQ